MTGNLPHVSDSIIASDLQPAVSKHVSLVFIAQIFELLPKPCANNDALNLCLCLHLGLIML